jgi:outer membrane protein OmpA-like peptidoglycan-associated protein
LGIDVDVDGGNRLMLDLGDKVQFANGSVTLDAEAEGFLTALAVHLVETPPSQALVIGHTDRQGGAYINARLSERRAEAVMTFLSGSGLSAVDWRFEGRGETEPKIPLEEAWIVGPTANRRIELELVWSEDGPLEQD